MQDIILDTHILSDFFSQYFDDFGANRGYGKFVEKDNISRKIAQMINRIVDSSRDGIDGLVLTSSISFIEIFNQFEKVSKGNYQKENIYDFLLQPPEWFQIEPVDYNISKIFLSVPPYVFIESKMEPIEWVDGIHVATLLSRDENAMLATLDLRINAIGFLKERLLSN